MPNYRLSLDLSDIYIFLVDFRDFTQPFMFYFIEANSADEACHQVTQRIIKELLQQDNSISTRLICRKIRKLIRIDKIELL
jgi:hypothetical protein